MQLSLHLRALIFLILKYELDACESTTVLWVKMEINSLSIPASLQLCVVKEKSFVVHLYNPSGEVRRLVFPPRETIFSTKSLQNH